jgi:CheY-like chemotaxis protein
MTDLEGTIMDESDRNMDQFLTTSVLLIDGSKNHRAYWAEQLTRCSPNYVIVEASDGQSGLDLFRSRRIDCVVLELSLPDQSGFQTLVDLVPIASRPQVAVIVFTLMTNRGVWEVAEQNGAYTCLAKEFTTGDDLDKAIQRAVAFVGQMPKEDRAGPSNYSLFQGKLTLSSAYDSSLTEYDKLPRYMRSSTDLPTA